jgi:hypothetical protein
MISVATAIVMASNVFSGTGTVLVLYAADCRQGQPRNLEQPELRVRVGPIPEVLDTVPQTPFRGDCTLDDRPVPSEIVLEFAWRNLR